MVSGLLIGYARVSTEGQDLTVQRAALEASELRPSGSTSTTGSPAPTGPDRVCGRHWLPAGAVTPSSSPSWIAWPRSLPDARDIADELTAREVRLQLGGSVHDPTDPVGRLLFNVLAMVAEFEADLVSMRTREGMRVP